MLDDLFDRQLTPTLVLDVLGDHAGEANGINARDLVRKVCGISTAGGERRLRLDAELDGTCEFLYARAMTSLTQIATLKRVALPDLRGQLRLRLEQK